MKAVGFIGVYDKIDLILYMAKIAVEMGKKVLVIDTTILQKAKYIVPSISPTRSYVTEYEGIDVAVGFKNYDEIKQYLGMPQHAAFDYDYAFLDIDTPEMLNQFNVITNEKNYFVTGMDLYSLKRGLEALSGLEEPIFLTKVVFSKKILKEDDEYLNFLSLGYKIQWNEELMIFFPVESGDQTVILENQRVSKIRLKKLTEPYRENLLYLAQDLLSEEGEGNIRKAFKQLEKGV